LICIECPRNAKENDFVCSDECYAKFLERWEDPDKPVTEQILEEMKRQGYDDKSVEFARKKISPDGEQDLDYAMGLANVLAMKKIGEAVLELVDADEGDSPAASHFSNVTKPKTDGNRD